jgi:tetratricopeptide (TPR) repeat protein
VHTSYPLILLLRGIESMHDEIRYKAAAAVVALGHRAESAGKKEAKTVKGGPWQPMPYEPQQVINPAKLREAVRYFEIAESIDAAAAAHGYLRAMVLEQMGEWDEAIAAYDGMPNSSGEEPLGSRRCREKQAGTYDELKFMGFSDEQIAMMRTGDDDEDDAAEAEFERKLAAAEKRTKQRGAERKAAIGDEDVLRDEATKTAGAFVNLLLDRNWKGARAMLARRDAAAFKEKDLQECFECLFEDEEFPEAANVFDVQVGAHHLEPNDLAWVYVTIESDNQEALSLIVTRNGEDLQVRAVEFGRP